MTIFWIASIYSVLFSSNLLMNVGLQSYSFSLFFSFFSFFRLTECCFRTAVRASSAPISRFVLSAIWSITFFVVFMLAYFLRPERSPLMVTNTACPIRASRRTFLHIFFDLQISPYRRGLRNSSVVSIERTST